MISRGTDAYPRSRPELNRFSVVKHAHQSTSLIPDTLPCLSRPNAEAISVSHGKAPLPRSNNDSHDHFPFLPASVPVVAKQRSRGLWGNVRFASCGLCALSAMSVFTRGAHSPLPKIYYSFTSAKHIRGADRRKSSVCSSVLSFLITFQQTRVVLFSSPPFYFADSTLYPFR